LKTLKLFFYQLVAVQLLSAHVNAIFHARFLLRDSCHLGRLNKFTHCCL
jgi:hypothetical protein